MKALGNFQYNFRLTLYFDEVNGNTGALDESVFFTIFRKSDNVKLQTIVAIPLEFEQPIIDYQASNCGTSSNAVKTKVLRYNTSLFLSSANYSDPQGYYIMWERCCRNNGIDNIMEAGSTGQTFLLEFPPVSKNGLPFENDSPVFKPVPNTLFCVNQPSIIDFAATDFDGDSLVFDLVDPIKSMTANTNAPAVDEGTPGPYDPVVWGSGYNTNIQIKGSPALSINRKTGL